MNPTRAFVDLSAIKHNIGLASRLNPGKRVCAVVKADAYGHGAVAVSKAAAEAGAGFLAVAQPCEARPLREAGISLPILSLGALLRSQLEEALELGLDICVPSPESLREIVSVAKRLKKTARVHIKADTGMGRLGVRDEAELRQILDIALGETSIDIAGFFTHFSSADALDDESSCYTQEQINRFYYFADLIKKAGFSPITHCQNSAAVIGRPDIKADMVRAGIMVYGLNPSGEVMCSELKPAMTWKTRIVHLKRAHRGDSISYGRLYRARGELEVATLPVGYADGYKRSMTGKAQVLVRGERRPVLGRVCMDQCMADVTGLNVSLGDEVILMGGEGNESITAEELGEWSNSFNYEIVSTIMSRVERVYIGGAK